MKSVLYCPTRILKSVKIVKSLIVANSGNSKMSVDVGGMRIAYRNDSFDIAGVYTIPGSCLSWGGIIGIHKWLQADVKSSKMSEKPS